MSNSTHKKKIKAEKRGKMEKRCKKSWAMLYAGKELKIWEIELM